MTTTASLHPSTAPVSTASVGAAPVSTAPVSTAPVSHGDREPTSIAMLSPLEAGLRLQLDADSLLEVVNRGLLPAFDLGGHVRFRACDVARVAREFATT